MLTRTEQTNGSKTETTLSSVDTRGSWPIESERLLGFWIGGSTLPVSFVEDPNFELFLQSYDIQVDFHPTQ